MANFTGSVNVKIYFGTKYDIINVPFNTSQIRTDATKTLTKNAQVVWQTTWITEINVNVEDYQDIVGAQFVEIIDTGVSNEGSHWYEVLLYQQISKKTVKMGLAYDPLLSIGISHITGISGILNRWTVDDDTAFKYTFSDEPINQIADYSYSYYRANPVNTNVQGGKIVGFPYDMLTEPEVIQYSNSVANATIYVPKLFNANMSQTSFLSDLGLGVPVSDGCVYYLWSPGSKPGTNYANALSLGYDLVSNPYILPISNMITLNINSSDTEQNQLSSIQTTSATYNTGFSLYDGSYNNRKAGETGIFFTLYNEFSGDNVTVPNYNLSGTGIKLYCDATPTGRFFARFASYLDDSTGLSGLVKSPGYRSFTLTQNGNFNSQTNALDNAMSQSVNTITYQQNMENLNRSYELNTNQVLQQSLMDTAKSTANALNNLLGGAIIGSVGSMVASGTANIINQEMAYQRLDVEYQNATNNLITQHNLQREMLNAKGTLGQLNPPAVKFANASGQSGLEYSFCVRKTTLKPSDRLRADRFFTAYGYNVNNTILNNVNQLNTRTRFTFVQANDVKIESLSGNTNLTRVMDFQTTNYINQRFNGGIRIWQTTPNLDWSISNPIRA